MRCGGRSNRGRSVFELFRAVSAGFRSRGAVLRHHPHQDAIHAAGWVSLFTLHALWPFLWIWAMAYRPERGWGISHRSAADGGGAADKSSELEDLRRRIAKLENSQRTGAR